MRLAPHDRDALQTKLFLLLQTDQYAAALAMTELPSSKEEEDGDYTFEKAYSLYRLHKEADASSALEELKAKSGEGEVDRGVLHLEAQLVRPLLYGVSYRGGGLKVCVRMDVGRRTGRVRTRLRSTCTISCRILLSR